MNATHQQPAEAAPVFSPFYRWKQARGVNNLSQVTKLAQNLTEPGRTPLATMVWPVQAAPESWGRCSGAPAWSRPLGN